MVTKCLGIEAKPFYGGLQLDKETGTILVIGCPQYVPWEDDAVAKLLANGSTA
jgi:hypothetical protein